MYDFCFWLKVISGLDMYSILGISCRYSDLECCFEDGKVGQDTLAEL